MKQELLEKNRKYIVAKSEDGEILGFAGLLINIDCTEIMNIVVKKSARKQGIGQQLLGQLLELSKAKGLTIINLEVNVKNEAAIRLYEKNGFKEIGRRKNYYNQTDDAVLLQKTY